MFGEELQPIDVRLPEWPSDSVWRFKPELTQDDAEEIAKIAAETRFEVDQKKRNEALRRGEDYIPTITVEDKASAVKAMLYHQSLGWEGTRFTYSPKANHPLAGKVVPCDLEWIGKLKPGEVDEIRLRLNKRYAGRSEDDTDRFPEVLVGGAVEQRADELPEESPAQSA